MFIYMSLKELFMPLTRNPVYASAVADFSAQPTSGPAPLRVAFTNASVGEIEASTWSFGDGITSTLEDPTHTYRAAGTYTVSLTVSGEAGSDTETKGAYITVRYGTYLPIIVRQGEP